MKVITYKNLNMGETIINYLKRFFVLENLKLICLI